MFGHISLLAMLARRRRHTVQQASAWTSGIVVGNLSRLQPLGGCKTVRGAKAVSKGGLQSLGGGYAW